jgi:hypothetical protein
MNCKNKYKQKPFSSAGLFRRKRSATPNFSSAGLFRRKRSAGQAAIEFIFIILIIVIYLFTVSKPILENSQGVVDDIERIVKTDIETKKIVNSINNLSLLANGSKETLNIIVQKDSEIICTQNKISFEVKINEKGNNPDLGICTNNICTKEHSIFENAEINCNSSNITYGKHILILTKENDKINFDVSDE